MRLTGDRGAVQLGVVGLAALTVGVGVLVGVGLHAAGVGASESVEVGLDAVEYASCPNGEPIGELHRGDRVLATARAALVRIDFIDGPSGSGPEWDFGTGEGFAAAVGDVGGSEAPRVVEAHADGVASAEPSSPAIDVVVTPSVESRVRAFVYEPVSAPEGSAYHGIPAPCLRPGGTGTATEAGTVGAGRETLHLQIDRLCPGWTYRIGLELTSLATGTVSYYGTRPPGVCRR